MKTPSESLFELIRSLTRSEKRFFVLHSGLQGGGKKYMKLFRAIEVQDRYDEKAIKAMFAGEKFVKQLTFTKEYLYRAVLGSLVKYHEGSTGDLELLHLMSAAQVLLLKGHFHQCLKTIRKAREKAEVNDKYALLMELLDMEKKLYMRERLLITSENRLNEIRAREIQYLSRLDELCIFRNLYAAIQREGIRNWRPRTNRELLPFRKIVSHPLLKKRQPPAGSESRFYYFHLHGMSHYFHRRLDKAISILLKAVQLLEERPACIANNPERYLASLSNVALAQIQADRLRGAWETLGKMRKHFAGRKLQPQAEARYISNYCIYSLNICLNTGRYEQGEQLIAEANPELERLGPFVTDEARIVFAFNASVLFFILARYKEALRWLNIVYRIELAEKLRLDLATFIRIFDLIIHIELQNHELLVYKLKSVYRYLAGKKRVYAFESAILDIMKRQLKVKSKNEETEVYKYARTIFEGLSRKPFEREALDRFDFLSWIDSKLTRKPFRELTQAKAHAF